MTPLTLRVEVSAGTDVRTAAAEAIRVAALLGVRVRFAFNGVEMRVSGRDTPDGVRDRYFQQGRETS